MKNAAPIFVVLEGIDGSGHTTQATTLAAKLQKEGVPSELTHEPTDAPIGRLIRGYLSGQYKATQPETIATQFLIDRYEHYWGQIVPWLESGKTVVCDRYHLSWEVYQSQSLTREWLDGINRYLTAIPPHLTIVLDMTGNEEEAMKRVDARGGTKEIYEKLEFQKEISAKYTNYAQRTNTSTVCTAVIDATLSIEHIANEIWTLATSVQDYVKEYNDLLNESMENKSFTPTGVSAIYWKSVRAREHYLNRRKN